METTTVYCRLSREAWARFSAEAAAQGVPLGTHVRRRLEEHHDLLDQVAALRLAVERAPTSPAAGAREPSVSPGALLEILLLLRSLVGPQKAIVAQKEVERRGLEIWS